MATRTLTTPDLLEQKSRPVHKASMKSYRCDTHALEETQETDANGQAAFTALTTEVDHVFWINWSGVTDGRKYQWFPIRFMEIEDGGTGSSTVAGARTNLGLGTADSPQFEEINLGHASDTTLARVSAGTISIEGKNLTRGSTQVVSANDSYVKTQADHICDGTDD